MTFVPLELAHQAYVEDKLSRLSTELADYFFPTLFLGRHAYGDQLHQGTFAAIKSFSPEEVLTPLDPLTPESLAYYQTLGRTFFPIPDNWLPAFASFPHTKKGFEAEDEYLYPVEQIRTFPGRHLAGQRNHINKFLDLYPDHEVLPLAASTEAAAVEILQAWHKSDDDDFAVCREALQLMAPLKLQGRLLLVNKKPAGFTLGGSKGSLFILKFMKAKTEYKGIYPFLYQDIAKNLLPDTLWLNLEQDLGLPSLKRAKESYHPHHKARAWHVTI